MEAFNLNSTPIYFHLLLFFLFTACTSADLIPNNPLQGIACSVINCGQGTCNASKASLLGFDCLCNPGWQKIQIGPFSFPYCVIPNCTIDFQCGNRSPSQYPPPPPVSPLSINFSDPCGLTWCGEGTCMPKGTGHTCRCYQGSANLMNNSELACFKECSLGAECHSLGFGQPMAPPPPVNSGSPASSNDHVEPTPATPNSSRKLRALTLLLLPTAIIFTWF